MLTCMERDLLAEFRSVEMPLEVAALVTLLEHQVAEEGGLESVGTWGVDLSTVYAIDMTRESTRKLVEYWVHGEGAAKIKWGVSGSMKRCIRHLTGKVRGPGGLCAEYHRLATGEWPTEHGEAGIPS
jgi:hypothetical protein